MPPGERENQHEPSSFLVLNGGKLRERERLPIKLGLLLLLLPTLQRRQSSVSQSVGLAAAIWLYWAQLVGSSLCLALPISDAVASSAITRNIAAHCRTTLIDVLSCSLSEPPFGLLKSIIYVDDHLPALLLPSSSSTTTRMLSMSCDGAAASLLLCAQYCKLEHN